MLAFDGGGGCGARIDGADVEVVLVEADVAGGGGGSCVMLVPWPPPMEPPESS